MLLAAAASRRQRTDGLWRHTCFEAFICRRATGEYWEYNFSPSGAWAAYQFSGYRAGMQPLAQDVSARDSCATRSADSFELSAHLDLRWLAARHSLRHCVSD